MSFEDATSFAGRLSNADPGRVYQLPTERQWEYACRAGTSSTYSFGESIEVADANFSAETESVKIHKDGSVSVYVPSTIEVGSRAHNNWGLYDMHGNVAELCRSPGAGGVEAVLRGGSHVNGLAALRVAFRLPVPRGRSAVTQGFRLVSPLVGESR